MTMMKLGIRGKIYCGIISVVLLTGLLIAVPVRIMVERALTRESLNKGISMAMMLATRSQDVVLGMDFLYLKEMIDRAVQSSSDVSYAFIINQRGQVLSHTFHNGFPVVLKTINPIPEGRASSIRYLDTGRELIYDIAVPIQIDGLPLGAVHIGLSKTKINHTIHSLLWTIGLLIACSIMIACLAGAGFANQIIRRVLTLHRAAEQIMKGNLDVSTAPALRKHCWDLMQCSSDLCPAYGERMRRCWYVSGTLCPNCREGEYAVKGDICKTCEIYRAVSGDEIQALSESFEAMSLFLKQTISQLEVSRKAIEVSEEKYRRIFDSSMDMVFVADIHGGFVDVNQTGVMMLEFCDKQSLLASWRFSDIFSRSDDFLQICRELNSLGFVRDREFILKTGGGNERQVMISVSRQEKEGGESVICEGIIKDITQRRNMEMQLLQADKLASLGQLSAGVAHEINNPLGLILGFTQLMLREEAEGSQKFDDLKTIEKHTRNCKSVVEALLNFARKTETRKAQVDVNAAIGQVVVVVAHQFEVAGVEIQVQYDPSLPPVLGDAEKLKQVVMNLVMNARQAIEKNGRITISTEYDERRRQVIIRVKDTGTGIAPQILSRIFDPFFTTKPTGQGTGLGLSVSYGIVKEHNGDIQVLSEPDKGSLFSVTLPAALSTES